MERVGTLEIDWRGRGDSNAGHRAETITTLSVLPGYQVFVLIIYEFSQWKKGLILCR